MAAILALERRPHQWAARGDSEAPQLWVSSSLTGSGPVGLAFLFETFSCWEININQLAELEGTLFDSGTRRMQQSSRTVFSPKLSLQDLSL